MLLQPNKKTMKRLREVLNDLYKHLDSSAAAIIDVSTLVVFVQIVIATTEKHITLDKTKHFIAYADYNI